MRKWLLALCMVFTLAAPAALRAQPAQSAPPAAAVAPDRALTTRLQQVVDLLNGKGNYDEMFSAEFRAAVPQDKFQAIAGQLKAQGGRAMAVESVHAATPWAATATIAFERLLATVQIAVSPIAPNPIVGLRITGAEPRNDSMSKLEGDFRALPGTSGFGVYALSDRGVTPVTALNGTTAAPIGSAFKLWVLAEAARQVNAGSRRWNEVIPVGPHSLPSGMLQKWPAHAPVTLQTLASLMISISDNTAADTLLTGLGRDRVGAMLRTIGVSAPGRTVPLLTTREAFELKAPANAELAAAWAKSNTDARRKLLADQAPRLAATSLDPLMFGASPMAIDTVEWFASPEDMARTLNWLRLHGDATTRAILGINPGVSPAAAARFSYIGFKGGSEAGVIALNYLVEARSGQWFAVTGNWHDTQAPVDEAGFLALMNRALLLIADHPAKKIMSSAPPSAEPARPCIESPTLSA